MSLVEVITAGMNNPDCSFFTGAFFGQFIAVRYMLALAVAYFVISAVNKLAFQPILDWIKNKIYGVKK